MKPRQNLLFVISTLLFATHLQANTAPQQNVDGYLGLSLGSLTAPLRAYMPDDVDKNQGVYVAILADISPAADDGIKLYDVLLDYDGKPIKSADSLIQTIRNDKPGRVVNIRLVRQGQVLTLPVTLGSQAHVDRPVMAQTAPTAFQQGIPQSQPQNGAVPPAGMMAQRPYPGGPFPGNGFPPSFANPSLMNPSLLNPMAPRPGAFPPPGYPAVQPYNAPASANAPTTASTATPALTPLNILGQPAYPMRKKIVKEKHAWGDKRNIWSDFYTGTTGDFWDKMINAPYDVGRMPGGWRAPSWSSPDPVTVGDAVLNQIPPMMEESGNMLDFKD